VGLDRCVLWDNIASFPWRCDGELSKNGTKKDA
jgi:hypothetical protein